MDDGENVEDAFRIPDLLSPSLTFHDVDLSPEFPFPAPNHDDFSEKLLTFFGQHQPDDGGFVLLDLSFAASGDDALSTPDSSTEATSLDRISATKYESEVEIPDDVWASICKTPVGGTNFLSWDAFDDQLHEEPHTAYITEAGPEAFDAALAGESDILCIGNTKHVIIKPHIYASSLLSLGLGRSSVLFSWNDENQTFAKTINPVRVPGCTGETVDGLTAVFLSCGNTTKALQSFVDKVYQAPKSTGQVALAETVSTLLTTLQAHFDIPVSSLTSFLRLQSLFKPAEALLTSFHHMVKSVSSTDSDEAMLSQLYHEIQSLEHRTDSMRHILLEVLARVSRPFLDFMGEWIGLQRDSGVRIEKSGPGKSFVKVEDRVWIDEQGLEMQEADFVLDSSHMPSFIQNEDAHTMFETGKSLRFLKTHHSTHPMAQIDTVLLSNPPTFEWKFSWQHIEQVEEKAFQYERDLITTIRKYSQPSTEWETSQTKQRDKTTGIEYIGIFDGSDEELEARLSKSIAELNLPIANAQITNKLSWMLNESLSINGEKKSENDATFAPPISLVPLLSFAPIISAQARVVNGTSMRLFFKVHNLREHLSIQRRFQLLGNGVFSSRLSHALFDPELETAERKAGVARSGGIMGLRLEGRDSWPPASSELRLALMGVLTESYISASADSRENAGSYLDHKTELPGDLSFAVREMTDEEIEKCKEPNSVEALDFLRLSYKPPPPLEAVITPLSLYKYDQLFKLLLRVVRMLFVVNQLFRDATDRTSYWQGVDTTAQRFRIEAYHFVSCISGYFFDTGVDATWRILERKLDQVEERIHSDTDQMTLGPNEGLDKLRDYHERVLDRIMFALLLRKRQQPVMNLLEEIFTTILHFAKHSRSRALGVTRTVGQDKDVKEMYLRFRRKVEVFITVCRGLGEKKGYGEMRLAETRGLRGGGLFDCDELAEENTIVQLLARLEMSNYYSRPVNL